MSGRCQDPGITLYWDNPKNCNPTNLYKSKGSINVNVDVVFLIVQKVDFLLVKKVIFFKSSQISPMEKIEKVTI